MSETSNKNFRRHEWCAARVGLITALLGMLITAILPGTARAAPSITHYALPIRSATPTGITAGPDGNLWFIEEDVDKIGRITPTGTVTEFPLPANLDLEFSLNGIVGGPDGNVWFAVSRTRLGNNVVDRGAIGRITPAGAITIFPVPDGFLNPLSITRGPDGALYFTDAFCNCVGRITVGGQITRLPLPGDFGTPSVRYPVAITAGPDGNLWVLLVGQNKIGRVTLSGAVTEFAVPTATAMGIDASITTGADGNLWFTENRANKIGRITPAGVITEFPVPTPKGSGSGPTGITMGSDGNLWFTESGMGRGSKFGRVAPDGTITEIAFPDAAGLAGITMGPDGNLWFTESRTGKIGRLTLDGSSAPPARPGPSPPAPGPTPPSVPGDLPPALQGPPLAFPPDATPFAVAGAFRARWEGSGGLPINGYPLSVAFRQRLEDGQDYWVQYFERVRMEYHPEVADPRDQVLLGQFGRRLHPLDPPAAPQPGAAYFAETQHTLDGGFLAYWQANGQLAQFGFPLSEVFTETLEDGNAYQVQYFERARFEYHGNEVLLGQFGRRVLAETPR